ncbi:MAG: SH3 domain-containing protein [Cyanothece sp. SIO2G6]|nr:SH3 domain-containing protein [Cyanothece sp. SIO2G6]
MQSKILAWDTILRWSMVTVFFILSFPQAASALPAILMTQDVGSRVNVRSQPTTQAPIVHQGMTGDRLQTLQEAQGDDGFIWYEVRFEDASIQGWVRSDLLQLGTHETPIRTGNYWVGPVGMGLEVTDTQYRFYDEMGNREWEAIATLQSVMDGVVLYGDEYWCHSELPPPELLPGQPPTITQCTENGWEWLKLEGVSP